MNPTCLGADLLSLQTPRPNIGPQASLARRLRQLTVREAEVEDGSLGTVTPVTPADFGFTIRDLTVDIGIYCRRSVDDIPRLQCLSVRKIPARDADVFR
jgi:hypothetical protein